MAFSSGQMYAVEITEKVGSVFSLLGTAFIITTFLSDKSFHKPINRLVFFAAWGNIMSNVATLISTSGIRLGSHGSLCQFQAFLIQWYALSAFFFFKSGVTRLVQLFSPPRAFAV